MKVYKIVQVGACTFIVVAIVSNTMEALNKEPTNIPNATYEQPHAPDNQQLIPQYTSIDTAINTSGTTGTTMASGNIAAKLVSAGLI
jgi:hypothetical protein